MSNNWTNFLGGSAVAIIGSGPYSGLVQVVPTKPNTIRERLQSRVTYHQDSTTAAAQSLAQSQEHLAKLDNYNPKTIELYDKLVAQNLIRIDYLIDTEFKTLDEIQLTIDTVEMKRRLESL